MNEEELNRLFDLTYEDVKEKLRGDRTLVHAFISHPRYDEWKRKNIDAMVDFLNHNLKESNP